MEFTGELDLVSVLESDVFFHRFHDHGYDILNTRVFHIGRLDPRLNDPLAQKRLGLIIGPRLGPFGKHIHLRHVVRRRSILGMLLLRRHLGHNIEHIGVLVAARQVVVVVGLGAVLLVPRRRLRVFEHRDVVLLGGLRD